MPEAGLARQAARQAIAAGCEAESSSKGEPDATNLFFL